MSIPLINNNTVFKKQKKIFHQQNRRLDFENEKIK